MTNLKKKKVYEYLERRICILDLQIVGIRDRTFGRSVYVIYNRGLISFFCLTIIHSNQFYLWLKHDHTRTHKNSIKPINKQLL